MLKYLSRKREPCSCAQPGFRSTDGSAITVVVILTALVVIVGAAIISLSISEKRSIDRSNAYRDAQNTAESLGEYVAAEIISKYKRSAGTTTLVSDLQITDRAFDIFADTLPDDVDDLEFAVVIRRPTDDDGRELRTPILINEGNPFYARDFDVKGERVIITNMDVYTKSLIGTVEENETIAEEDRNYLYLKQTYTIREKSLLDHLIFFNTDLTIGAVTGFTLKGDIHGNYNVSVNSLPRNPVSIDGKLSISGSLLHDDNALYSDYNDPTGKLGNVYMKAGEDENGNTLFANMYIPDSELVTESGISQSDPDDPQRKIKSNWIDSLHSNFDELVEDRWNGFVQVGRDKLNPLGVGDYKPRVYDRVTGDLIDEGQNNAYALIEPLIPNDPKDQVSAVSRQKFAAKAGLIFRVQEDGSIKAFTYNNAGADPQDLVEVEITKIPEGLIGAASKDISKVETDGQVEEYIYNSVTDEVESGLYDWRHGRDFYNKSEKAHERDPTNVGGTSLATLDISVLKESINNGNAGDWGGQFNPATDWNGVVYVEFPVVDTPDRPLVVDGDGNQVSGDGIHKVKRDDLALQIINGNEVPSRGTHEGFTLATNAPLYVNGSFNADGDLSTGSVTEKDSDDEVPAVLVADAVTVLSDAWSDAARKHTHKPRHETYAWWADVQASDTEIAAGIIAGTSFDQSVEGTAFANAPFLKGFDGELQNFVRTEQESWAGDTIRIRGSIVSLFQSEARDRNLQAASGDYHRGNPPKREFGFHEDFESGKLAPGVPKVVTYRKTGFSKITKEEFDNAVNNQSDTLFGSEEDSGNRGNGRGNGNNDDD